MDFQEVLNNKSLKAKQKTAAIATWLTQHPKKIDSLISFAAGSKDVAKAVCIEAIESATRSNPAIASPACLDFVSKSLNDDAPKVKLESARVVGNIAHLYPTKLNLAVKGLLANSKHPGTVVRWSAAFALAQIIKLKTRLNKELVLTVQNICRREDQNSIRKIYLQALKKIGE